MGKRKREFTDGSNGYFCVAEDGAPLIQGEADKDGRAVWLMADEPLVVEKMFGPLAFMGIRVTAAQETCEWVIERQSGADNEWREVARIPGQLPEDFPADFPEGNA